MTSTKVLIKNHSILLYCGILQMNKCLAPNTAPKSNRTLHEFGRWPDPDTRPAPALALPGPPTPSGKGTFTRAGHKGPRSRAEGTDTRQGAAQPAGLGRAHATWHPTRRLSKTGFHCPLRWSPEHDGKLCPSVHAPQKSKPAPSRPPQHIQPPLPSPWSLVFRQRHKSPSVSATFRHRCRMTSRRLATPHQRGLTGANGARALLKRGILRMRSWNRASLNQSCAL